MLKKAENDYCFLKCGILGFAGGGKTFTASNIAIGLHQHIKAKKPVAFMDTEQGSSFVLPKFQKNSIELLSIKSRAFVDLLDVVKEAEKNCSILIIDSITHIWNEFMSAFQKKKDVKRIQLYHWTELKQDWRVFTDLFINSHLHIVLCGRAGWEFDQVPDESGAMQLTKTGTKMKTESEQGFEPSLLVEMERKKTDKIGGNIINRAWVLKDRADKINGKFFDNPTFDDFLPHIKALNLGGKHIGVDTSKTSENFFNGSPANFKKKKDIILEEIKDEMLLLFPGQSAEDKKGKVEKLQKIFDTSSWTKISNEVKFEDLEKGLKILREENKTK